MSKNRSPANLPMEWLSLGNTFQPKQGNTAAQSTNLGEETFYLDGEVNCTNFTPASMLALLSPSPPFSQTARLLGPRNAFTSDRAAKLRKNTIPFAGASKGVLC